uniref:RhuM family protein n=1 Tax=Dyadobacter sp. MSC1_007 TaxID=2909264 RepID=UPI00286DBFEE|nr:RhuM family protein [Dyadobacter sp. MSC1_007]
MSRAPSGSAKSKCLICSIRTPIIGLHLKNIFNEKELEAAASSEDFSVVQREGKRQVKRTIKFYNLDAVISVGYRATQNEVLNSVSG